MSEASGTLPCPTCGVVAARIMSAGAGLLFKGSGFYITDYGKDGKKDQRDKTAADSKAAAAAVAASTPAATDSKAAKPADAKPAPAAAPPSGKSEA